MSLRELIDPECGGANPLMRLGNHIVGDAAHKDDGISGRMHDMHFVGPSTSQSQGFNDFSETNLVNEFLDQMSAPPPQTFRMDALLKEMREIDAQHLTLEVAQAPSVSAEVNTGLNWATEFGVKSIDIEDAQSNIDEKLWQDQSPHSNQPIPLSSIQHIPNQSTFSLTTAEFFDKHSNEIQSPNVPLHSSLSVDSEQFKYSEFMRFMNKVSDGDVNIESIQQPISQSWTDEFEMGTRNPSGETTITNSNPESDWIQDFAEHKTKQDLENENYNKQFWERLQDEWKKISNRVDEPSWLSEFSEYYDPYREYTFDEENPMLNVENVIEKGKAFLAQGDVPSAVLCFEAALRHDDNNAEVWELLGTSQAENEKDPNAIAALKKSLELKPQNRNALMSLAISYTNESLQNQALRALIDWLRSNEKYQHLVPEHFQQSHDAMMASSLINGIELADVQTMFIQAVQQSPLEIDAEIQEALGVLFNLSSDYDKAADCFRAALQIKPNSAKIWNRLGASLANGNESVQAVDAYQHALAIEPGYIRARYNVGIICINLKAYKEAIEHFLMALNHQATSMERSGLQTVKESINQMSDTIWSTLRMAISLMGRFDLQETIDKRDLQTLNRAFKTNE